MMDQLPPLISYQTCEVDWIVSFFFGILLIKIWFCTIYYYIKNQSILDANIDEQTLITDINKKNFKFFEYLLLKYCRNKWHIL